MARHLRRVRYLRTGEISLIKSDEAQNHAKEVYDYIKEREIDDIATYDHESVMELASDFVGDHIVPEGVDEEYGNSDEYVDLLDWWCEIFSYNIAELAMCHFFEKHKHLVDR
ncbi:MAG: hypothetical protein IKA07_03340 [Alistipes sp.]|nr:hypothetical protein [Alistipes sp.]